MPPIKKSSILNVYKMNIKNRQKKTEDVNLTSQEHKRALKRAYKSFVVTGLPKVDTKDYVDRVKAVC